MLGSLRTTGSTWKCRVGFDVSNGSEDEDVMDVMDESASFCMSVLSSLEGLRLECGESELSTIA